MSGKPKIAFIGAGSTAFMRTSIGDVLQVESLKGAHVALMDIDKARLEQSMAVAARMVDELIAAHGRWLREWISD